VPLFSADVNGNHTQQQNAKGKKRNDAPIDPATMYESLKNRIAALEEEEVLEEEEERRIGKFANALRKSAMLTFRNPPAEEAHKSVKGLNETAIHTKYIELVRLEISSRSCQRS